MSHSVKSFRPELRVSLLGMRLRIAKFLEHLKTTSNRVILLEYDGTVAPFTVDRQSALPYPEIPELLNCMMRVCRTRVVLISERPIADLLPVLGDHFQPEIWGSHGLERFKPDGTYERIPLNNAVELLLETAISWMEYEGFAQHVELKVSGVTLHWRGQTAEFAKRAWLAAARVWTPLTWDTSLQLIGLDEGIELRVAEPNKTNVVSTVLAETAIPAAVAYLGHDCMDEEGFLAIKGKGLGALVRPNFYATKADVWLRPPGELLAFLNGWISAAR
jgi:trehalose 6-phosphate phosphatase